MAVLGRVLGIPSRVVWGFTPGEVVEVIQDDQPVEQVIVRDRNAHSWVELWIDGFGWAKFDPTPRGGGVLPESITADFDPTLYLPVPLSPEQPSLAETPEELLDGRGAIEGEDQGGLGPTGAPFPLQWLFVPAVLLLVAVLIPAMKALRRRQRIHRLREGDITAAWEEIVDQLTDLGQPVPAYQTPKEFADSTDETLVPLAENYSAAVYGGRNGLGIEADIELVDDWLRRRYEPGQRTLARFNPRSLLDRRRSG